MSRHQQRESLTSSMFKGGCGCATCGLVLLAVGLAIFCAGGGLLMLGGAR